MNKVSIIIPARNEEKYISKCLDSVLQQSYSQDLIEIIVIDGMSTDNTESIVRQYMEKYKNIKLLFNERSVTPVSMNIGIKNSTGDITIIFGAHSFMDEHFVKNNVRNLLNNNVDCSGGVVKFINEGFMTKCIALATSCTFGAGNALYRYTDVEQYVDTVPFGAYKKHTLDIVGYFDEELVRNQDDELNFRVTENGGKILLSPDIISFYYSRSSLKKLWLQYKQYGFWKVRVIQKHKRPAALRHLVPVLFLLTLLVTGFAGIFSDIFRGLFYFVMASYLTVDILYSFKVSLKNEFSTMKCLPIIFPIIHIGYGYGFMLGIINFYMLKSNKISSKNKEYIK